MTKAWWQSRYDRGTPDYINCPMTAEEYRAFWEQLTTAEEAEEETLKMLEVYREVAEDVLALPVYVGRKSDKTSSTRIGVKTCVNMMKMMNGSFVTKTEDGIFTASLSLPLSEMK